MRLPRALCRSFAALLFALTAGIAGAAELARWAGGATPPLALTDLAGNAHALEQYRGKVVLVNFWATWCEPCRDEMPSMDRLRHEMAGQPFVILAVNVDEPEQRIRNFLQRLPVGFDVLLDPGMRATKVWNARILPASFLLGRDGRIRYSVRGDLDWSSDAVVRVVRELARSR